MTAVRITKFERHGDFFTANVTPEDGDTVRVDNSVGSWTLTVDQAADPASRSVTRRDVLPAVARKLQDRLRSAISGELDDGEAFEVNGNGRPPSRAQIIAARMAAAGHRAVAKEGELHV